MTFFLYHHQIMAPEPQMVQQEEEEFTEPLSIEEAKKDENTSHEIVGDLMKFSRRGEISQSDG